MRPVPVRPDRRLHPFRHADTTSPDSLLCSPPNYSTSEVWFLLRCQHRHCKPLFFFYSRWEQAGYALWSCNAASSNLFHWSTVGENKPRNENKRLRASNISFFQKIVGYKYFMRRIFFIYVLFKDISDTQCSLVRNCEWLFFFFFTKWSTGHPKILYFHQFVQICFHFFIHLFSPGDCVNTYLHSVLF